ncbi:MAG: NPCBM/NEW2 domain-containing protein, partial [Deltaproteobacteria bacterium]|nr:NPCBM/NEW2 domain-containing protein [Deltaproteobacteria bacterium]
VGAIKGNPLSINNVPQTRGVGTHTSGSITIQLDGKATRFTALVGVDDEVHGHNGVKRGSVNFQVRGDGKELWQSGIMTSGMHAKSIDLKLNGIHRLRLIAHPVDNIEDDHANWAMAKIEYRGATPRIVAPPRPKPYILTPEPGPKPRLTGPAIFGARPGAPFLHTLTATGKRPLSFQVDTLPEGLTLDPDTGRITGTVMQPGSYETLVTARNAEGDNSRSFTIVIGDTIALTPPMGWNSWNSWGNRVDADKVRASALAMVNSGLSDHGWHYINIDDCWMRKKDSDDPALAGEPRDENGNLIPNARFPDMKALTDTIHGLGLKAGIYTSPGPETCEGFAGSWQYEQQDAQQFAAWGFDYLKYDWCGYSEIARHRNAETLQRPFHLMRSELDRINRDMVYSICEYGWGRVWRWGESVGANCWRTGSDIVDTWSSVMSNGFRHAAIGEYTRPGHWNDPDMLVVGKVGWGKKLRDTRLNAHEQYAHISLWCLLSAPLLIGCPIEKMDDFTFNLLSNDEVLEVNQDILGQQARQIVAANFHQIWAKDMQDGSKAVGLFNLDDFDDRVITLDFSDLDLTGRHTVRDLWRQKNLGDFSDQFSINVPPHGVALVRIHEYEEAGIP